MTIEPGSEQNLDMFFSLAPSPKYVELTYVDANGEHQVLIDTIKVLDQLHLAEAAD